MKRPGVAAEPLEEPVTAVDVLGPSQIESFSPAAQVGRLPQSGMEPEFLSGAPHTPPGGNASHAANRFCITSK